MKVKFKKAFKFAKGGHTVVTFLAGEEADIEGRCLEIARECDVLETSKGKKNVVPETKKLGAAPENKSK